MSLDTSLLEALRPRSLRERLGLLLQGGFSAKDVLLRLPAPLQAQLGGEGEPVIRDRRAIEQVQRALIALSQQGKVQRRQRSAWVELKSKGHRSVLIDVFRLTPG